MPETSYLIEASGLCKYYPVTGGKLLEKKRQVKAVEGLELKIPKGCTFGLVGESGCGKSTAGQLLSHILTPTSGTVRYRGKALGELKHREQKQTLQKIQMVFQDPYSSLNPRKSIGWTLEEPLKIHTRLRAQERRARVAALLETVGLDAAYAKRYPRELSGGQRQRVSIAAALILDPEFVIADESVSALDVSVQAQILNLLKRLQRERGLTYLFISHDLNVVQYMSDYIGVMYLGHLVEQGPADAVCEAPAHPYTRALLSAVPRLEGEKRPRIVLEGEVPSPSRVPEGCPFHTRCPHAEELCKKSLPKPRSVSGGHLVCCHRDLKECTENTELQRERKDA